jgi:hypothetical protein
MLANYSRAKTRGFGFMGLNPAQPRVRGTELTKESKMEGFRPRVPILLRVVYIEILMDSAQLYDAAV